MFMEHTPSEKSVKCYLHATIQNLIFLPLVNRYTGGPVLGAQYLGSPLPRPPLFSTPLYTSSPPFHTLLAGLAAPPRQSPDPPPVSPPISPGSESPPAQPSAPEIERRSSSIAALRMAAREHELRLEILRQRHHPDLIS